MDQDSFRRLLDTPNSGAGTTPRSNNASRGSLLPTGSKAKASTVDASQPAFKPRKITKQTDSKYRDRAAERRVGKGNDFAEVEAVLEDFEKRAVTGTDKDEIEQQRRYLGGDKDHTVLVKGLDFALFEQNKARAAASTTEDDDSLERALLDSNATERGLDDVSVSKKKTKAELLKELKQSRQGTNGDAAVSAGDKAEVDLDVAKRSGKFKPIGFKPIGPSGTEKKKRKEKDRDAGERKKKKLKVESTTEASGEVKSGIVEANTVAAQPEASSSVQSIQQSPLARKEPEPVDEDFDIFAGAGDYEGVDLGSEGEDDGPERAISAQEEGEIGSRPVPVTKGWFDVDEMEPGEAAPPSMSASPPRTERTPAPSAPERMDGDEGDAEDDQPPMRLQPLASSALPSVRELLELDQAAGAGKRKNKKKGKRKGGDGDDAGDGVEKKAKMSKEVKVERDYKRLQSYTEKKAKDSA